MERDTASLVTGKKGWEGKKEGGGRDGNGRKKGSEQRWECSGQIDGRISIYMYVYVHVCVYIYINKAGCRVKKQWGCIRPPLCWMCLLHGVGQQDERRGAARKNVGAEWLTCITQRFNKNVLKHIEVRVTGNRVTLCVVCHTEQFRCLLCATSPIRSAANVQYVTLFSLYRAHRLLAVTS